MILLQSFYFYLELDQASISFNQWRILILDKIFQYNLINEKSLFQFFSHRFFDVFS